MSTEWQVVLQQFAQRVRGDAEFRKKVEQDPAGVLAQETGLTGEQLRQHVAEVLGDDELSRITAGSFHDWARDNLCTCGRVGMPWEYHDGYCPVLWSAFIPIF